MSSRERWYPRCSELQGQLVRVHFRESFANSGGRVMLGIIDGELRRVDDSGIAIKPVTERFPNSVVVLDFDQLREVEAL